MKMLLQLLVDEEITLKQLTLPDTESLFALTDKNRSYLKQWLSWLDRTQSIQDTEKFIQNSIDQAVQNKAAVFGIYYKDNLVGVIDCNTIDTANRKAIIGYWLSEDTQGKGIMTRAVKEIIRFAFEDLQLNRVQINCATGNEKSCAVPKRLGFVKEGIIRQAEWLYDHFVDWEQYSLLRQDWIKTKNL